MRNNKIKVHYTEEQVLQTDSIGNFSKSPLKPKLLLEHFAKIEIIDRFDIYSEFTPFNREDFLVAHEESYVDEFFSGKGRCRSNGLDWSEQFSNSVRYTNASLYSAIKEALLNPETVQFSPTSGFHHARPSGGSGFCTFSGQVIASTKVYREFGARGAYLDLDGHFGNSIEDSRDFVKDLNLAVPIGFNFNPLNSNLEYLNDLKKFLKRLETKIIQKKIDYVVWCHGADSHEWDDLGYQCSTKYWLACAEVFWKWVAKMDSLLGKPLPVACALFGGYRRDSYDSVLNLHTGDFIECLNTLLGHDIKYTIKVKPNFKYGQFKTEEGRGIRENVSEC